jgi:Alpha amylase, catalytic domain
MAVPAWLSDAVLYQVYPQSFADSDGDGIGDLRGIAGHLDYLAWLGVTAVWLNHRGVAPIQEVPVGKVAVQCAGGADGQDWARSVAVFAVPGPDVARRVPRRVGGAVGAELEGRALDINRAHPGAR